MKLDCFLKLAEAQINDDAKACKFVVRDSSITGFHFVTTMTAGFLNTPEGTLNQMAAFLASTCDICVSAQAIDERFTAAAEELLKTIFELAVKSSGRGNKIDKGLLSKFEHIYIIDSTNFSLHPKLKSLYKGSSGSGSPSTMRIQLVYDYLTSKVIVQFGDTKLCDAPTLQRLVEDGGLSLDDKCLVLSDLGYFKMDTFGRISHQKGFFLSKLMFGMKFQLEDNTSMDIQDYFRKGLDSFELLITHKNIPYRVVAQKLPDHVINQRLRKANRSAVSKKGSRNATVSEAYRLFASYAVFITNLPVEFSMASLYTLYRLRWQIELIFKTWKSVLSIQKIITTKPHRLMCEIYGKLIIAAIANTLIAAIESHHHDVTISFFRMVKNLCAIAQPFANALVAGPKYFAAFYENQIRLIAKLCKKHTQRNKPYIEKRLMDMDVQIVEIQSPIPLA